MFPLKHYQDKIRLYVQLPSHKNITGVVEVILGDTKAYVFLEKDFGDMHSYVRSCKRLREEEAAKLFKQIVSAVAHCHQSAIVLGDLKLRKFVFSTEERQVMLTEWPLWRWRGGIALLEENSIQVNQSSAKPSEWTRGKAASFGGKHCREVK